MVAPGCRATRTIDMATLKREEPEELDIEDVAALAERPKTWGECRERTGPCPWVSCRAHRYLEVLSTGGIRLNFPDLDPMDLDEPCVLRIAERGGMHLEDVGTMLNITKEGVRLVETAALMRLRRWARRLL